MAPKALPRLGLTASGGAGPASARGPGSAPWIGALDWRPQARELWPAWPFSRRAVPAVEGAAPHCPLPADKASCWWGRVTKSTLARTG